MKLAWIVSLFGIGLCAGLGMAGEEREKMSAAKSSVELATLAGGCFWCTEAVFQSMDGVKSVKSGYTGGRIKNPTYEQVCSGNTGHAEAIQIEYDSAKVRYEDMLDVFWQAHDPTQMNRQGADVGTQYRSAIFYHSENQKAAAEKSKQDLAASGKFKAPIVTQIVPASEFYEAENYHQDYYRSNPNASYCTFVIRPKLKKLGLEK